MEYTGGSTGASLALVCAARGYPLQIVSSDAFSRDKLDQMAALGAKLTLVQSEGGLTTKKLILDMIEAARSLSQKPHTHWTDQLNNTDSIAGYHPLGEEIWSQTKGEIDTFVHCVGTAASSRGVAEVLKRHKPNIKIIAVEPAESSVLLGNPPGPHKIEGVGIGYTPPLWEKSLVDEILPVKTDDAKEMAQRLAREEGLFAGTSSEANVIAAIQVAKRLGPGAKVVTLMACSAPPKSAQVCGLFLTSNPHRIAPGISFPERCAGRFGCSLRSIPAVSEPRLPGSPVLPGKRSPA